MDTLWNKFYSSGKIADYLEYKRKQGGNNDADSNRSGGERASVGRER